MSPKKKKALKKIKKRKKSNRSRKAPPQEPLLTPTESQKVNLAVGLLLLFLTCFSFATGALEAGRLGDHLYYLKAVDTRGANRLKLFVFTRETPTLKLYRQDGSLYWDSASTP